MMTIDEALADAKDWRGADPAKDVLADEVERLRPIEKRALNLKAINEPMTSRVARVILGED